MQRRQDTSQRSRAAHRRGDGQVDGERLVAGGAARGARARARVLHRARAAEGVPARRAHRVLPWHALYQRVASTLDDWWRHSQAGCS